MGLAAKPPVLMTGARWNLVENRWVPWANQSVGRTELAKATLGDCCQSFRNYKVLSLENFCFAHAICSYPRVQKLHQVVLGCDWNFHVPVDCWKASLAEEEVAAAVEDQSQTSTTVQNLKDGKEEVECLGKHLVVLVHKNSFRSHRLAKGGSFPSLVAAEEEAAAIYWTASVATAEVVADTALPRKTDPS